MAEAAARHSADDPLSSPSSAVSGKEHHQQLWDLSVPNGQEQQQQQHNNAYVPTAKSRTSHDSTQTHPKPTYKHAQPHAVNGTALSRNSSVSGPKQGTVNEQGYLVPHRLDALGRRQTNPSRAGSEADSLLDLYGRESANRSAVSVMESGEKKGDKGSAFTVGDDDPENTNWIHRDKLARIESEELQQFGIQLHQRKGRTGSKSSRGRGLSHDSYSNGVNGSADAAEPWPGSSRDEKRQRIASPAPVENIEHEQSDDDGPIVFDDPRLPEEIAAESYEEQNGFRVYRMPGLRKSSSKIPVFASSIHPIPLEHLERETPLSRTRNNTLGSGDDESISYSKNRHVSDQTSPAAQLDTSDPAPISTTPPQGSRPGSGNNTNSPQSSTSAPKSPVKHPRKTSNPSNNRKSSTAQKPKATASSSSSNQRPVTRSGENRPEGDPPWLATMYKPDPRLPPDQQILPTHARRMQREIWEKEGKLPSTYDREFAPLAIQSDIFATPKAESEKPPEEPPSEYSAPPLLPPVTKSLDPSNRPGTSGTDRGYKTIPTVQTPAVSQTPKQHPRPIPVNSPPEEKGCGCCIIM
ncbi:hypothetical protein AJ80_03546 [Polytolypa hystricis UAMH7299]|uniref:TeaA receptor TeaR n=1 Tax=Polytolypa hystricis (strain UAMH7299) TaxID=1447883 RepID=A0A2B7YH99_POLH7|nr:hypothetical protein AJ80_03546 [Polytolypa hystricis UAMH7299]